MWEGRTQKSISRFPLLPNSLSPTWKVTVILSPECSCSWKHSRECGFICMLCAEERVMMATKAARTAKIEENMLKHLLLAQVLSNPGFSLLLSP